MISENIALNEGGGIWCYNHVLDLILINVTITQNQSYDNGGGIYFAGWSSNDLGIASANGDLRAIARRQLYDHDPSPLHEDRGVRSHDRGGVLGRRRIDDRDLQTAGEKAKGGSIGILIR